MTITKTLNGEALTIALEGRLDTIAAQKLEPEVKESLEGVSALTFDFEKLDYICSAGLRVLLLAQKTISPQGKMKVVHVNEAIMAIFEATGFLGILTIE